MGYLINSQCVADLSTAKQLHCRSFDSVWGNGTDLVASRCVAQDFTLTDFVVCKQVNAGACSNVTYSYPTFPSCSYDGSLSVASEYFAVVLSVVVIVFAAARLRRYFWGHHEGI